MVGQGSETEHVNSGSGIFVTGARHVSEHRASKYQPASDTAQTAACECQIITNNGFYGPWLGLNEAWIRVGAVAVV